MVGEGIDAFLRTLANSPATEPEPAGIAGFSVVWSPGLLSRNGVRYLRCRSWRRATKRTDLEAFRLAKLELDQSFVDAVAAEIVAVVNETVGRGLFPLVAPVACGHSRRPDCLSVRIAVAAAEGLGAKFLRVFENRFVQGVSHPKENAALPPLSIIGQPQGPVLLVDDVATSGFHIHEGVSALRAAGVHAMGAVWISGVKQ